METYKFKTPVEIDGEMRESVNYDFDSLTGEDADRAIKELAKRDIIVMVTETDPNYHAALFSIASGLAYEDVKRFSLKDYNAVCSLVRSYFLAD